MNDRSHGTEDQTSMEAIMSQHPKICQEGMHVLRIYLYCCNTCAHAREAVAALGDQASSPPRGEAQQGCLPTKLESVLTAYRSAFAAL